MTHAIAGDTNISKCPHAAESSGKKGKKKSNIIFGMCQASTDLRQVATLTSALAKELSNANMVKG